MRLNIIQGRSKDHPNGPRVALTKADEPVNRVAGFLQDEPRCRHFLVKGLAQLKFFQLLLADTGSGGGYFRGVLTILTLQFRLFTLEYQYSGTIYHAPLGDRFNLVILGFFLGDQPDDIFLEMGDLLVQNAQLSGNRVAPRFEKRCLRHEDIRHGRFILSL